MEILHKIGYCHNDLKLQNICFNQDTNKYTLIDFASVTKLFHRNGTHVQQEKLSFFNGNPLFSSDSKIGMKSTGRKDDLESLIYILTFLFTNSLPIIDYFADNLNVLNKAHFLELIQKNRFQNQSSYHSIIKNQLPASMSSAF